MKCIYCNSEVELTSSDIITYAITGAKLTKSFVCKTHNAFTNDNYEKKYVADLDFFRNHLGLTTRDGKPIQYKADISVDGTELHNVKISNRESLYAPKDVVAGTDDNGNKIPLLDENGKQNRWKIENSWGDKVANQGYFIGSDTWFDKYMYVVAVNKKFLSKEALAALDKEPVQVAPWDPFGTLAD